MAFTSDVCKILKCDGDLVAIVGKKQAIATPYQVAYGYANDALGKQIKSAALFGESTKTWNAEQQAAAVAYGLALDAAFSHLSLNNPDAGWINNFTKDVNEFTDTYISPLL